MDLGYEPISIHCVQEHLDRELLALYTQVGIDRQTVAQLISELQNRYLNTVQLRLTHHSLQSLVNQRLVLREETVVQDFC